MYRQKSFRAVFKCIFSMSLVFALVFSSAVVPRVYAADSLEDLQRQYEELEKKIKENSTKLEDIQSDMNSQHKTIDLLDNQISDINTQIQLINDRIAVIQKDINSINSKIKEIDDEIASIKAQIKAANESMKKLEAEKEKTINQLLERMRASYMAGSMSEIEILFSSSDFSTFFTRTELLKRLSEHDNKLVKRLEKEVKEIKELTDKLEGSKTELDHKKTELDVEKQVLVKKQADVQKDKDALVQKQNSVSSKVERTNDLLKQLDKSSKEYKRLIRKYAQEEAEIDAKIDEFIRNNGSSTDDGMPSGSENRMIWPVPYSNCYISAGYGYYSPFGYNQMHYGVDICVSGGSQGKNIVAAKSGTVQTSSWHSSYGNYILIDHGGGLFTLYAHCNTLLVGVGAKVKQGQVIAKIGKTGRVTGPHLHFEVRINDGGNVKRVNPLTYVSMPR